MIMFKALRNKGSFITYSTHMVPNQERAIWPQMDIKRYYSLSPHTTSTDRNMTDSLYLNCSAAAATNE